MDNTACNGSETKLTDCRHVSSDDCGPAEVAGVVCDQRSQKEIEDETRMVDECFETGVSYHHGKYLDFDIVTSAIACQQHCRNHDDCRFFTYYDSTHKCYRKRGSSKRLRAGAVSGPRNCSDNSSSPLPLTPPDNSYRIVLRGGSAPHEGNVLVGPEGSEKPVCDDNWTLINADVACKQLGWAGAVTMTKESRFGVTSPNFAMDQVRCDGTEERLVDCRHTKQDDCGAGEAAGAICDTRSEEELAQEQTNCFDVGFGYNPGDWIDFDIVASALDCQTHCRGHSECSFFTYYSDTGKCYRKTGSETRSERSEAISGPARCGNGTVLPPRPCTVTGAVCLANGTVGSEGHVYVGGRPVCDDSWDNKDGGVVCRQLGFSGIRRVTSRSFFGNVTSNFAMDNVNCRGHETSLALCDHSDSHDCNAGEAAGVVCETQEVAEVPRVCSRPGTICLLPGQGGLAGGGHPSRGNVYVGGKPICDDSWSNNSAAVICRELGWETGWATKESYFGPVHADFVLTNVQCNVQDRRLSACRFQQQ